MDKITKKFVAGFWLPESSADRFLLHVERLGISKVVGYREAIKMWCDAQDAQTGAQVVKSPALASPATPVKQVVTKPAPALPVPMWRVYGFIHGMAHKEAVANGWRPGMAIPAGFAAKPPACEETRGQTTETTHETRGQTTASAESSREGDFC